MTLVFLLINTYIYFVKCVLQKGRTSWARESVEPDVELYGGGRKGIKRYYMLLMYSVLWE